MWKDKGLQLVMLPTENSLLHLSNESMLLESIEPTSKSDLYDSIPQYLYLISDEKPNDGDMCLDGEYIFGPYEDGDFPVCSRFRSIIACLNPSLNLPQFPSSFLEEYIKRYNSKQPMEVELAYEEYDHEEEWSEIGGAYETSKERVTLNPDNTISIRFKEEKKYSRGEVEDLCGKAFDAGEAYRTGSCEGFKQIHPNKHEWIKENLK